MLLKLVYYVFGVAALLPQGSLEGVAEFGSLGSAHLFVQARVSGFRLPAEKDDGQNNGNPEKYNYFSGLPLL